MTPKCTLPRLLMAVEKIYVTCLFRWLSIVHKIKGMAWGNALFCGAVLYIDWWKGLIMFVNS